MKFPDVTVTLQNFTYESHAQLQRKINPLRRREREFGRKFRELDKKKVPLVDDNNEPVMSTETGEQLRGLLDPEDQDELVSLLEEFESFQTSEILPEYLRWAFISATGISTSDGKSITTPDDFLRYAPKSLTEEVIDAIKNTAELTPDEIKNSASPMGSIEQEPMGAKSTPVNDAKPTDTLPEETAPSSSQSS